MESPSIIDIDHQYMICVKKNVFGDIASLRAGTLVVTVFFVIDQVRVKIISQCSVWKAPLPIQSTTHFSKTQYGTNNQIQYIPCTNKSSWRKSQSQWIVHFALIILTFVPYRRTCLTDLIVKSEKVLFIVRSHDVYVRQKQNPKTYSFGSVCDKKTKR